MSHKNKKSLKQQMDQALMAMYAPGRSKHADKATGNTRDHIYSMSTLDAYKKHCAAFLDFVRERDPSVRQLADAGRYADEWIQSRIDAGDSAFTIKLRRAALVKLYQNPQVVTIDLPERSIGDITRSRNAVTEDRHFSEANNADLVMFCRATGLRRHELAQVTGEDLRILDGVPYVYVRQGKGGKSRLVPVIRNHEAVTAMMLAAGSSLVFDNISGHADIHGYRREYAQAVYDANARPLEDLHHEEIYYCRGVKKGTHYDRQALSIVSKALGHNRLSVAAENYLL